MVGNSGGGDTESEMLPKVLGALSFGEEEEEKKAEKEEEEEEEEAASGLQGHPTEAQAWLPITA